MRERCTHHPGLEAVITIAGRSFCQRCKDAQVEAARSVDGHVVPRDCFVWYEGRYDWRAIPGTGCAHWVAHQKDIHSGPALRRCLQGMTLRVTDLVEGLIEIKRMANLEPGDIYVTRFKEHCGLVHRVERDAAGAVRIEIEHDSNRQGGVFRNDFATYFKGQGSFHRKV